MQNGTINRDQLQSLWLGVMLVSTALSGGGLGAAPVQFTIDPAKSQISLGGTVLGNPLQEQGPGSLSSTFSGTILANVSTTGIQFTGGSALAALTNGVWKPGLGGASGSAPADYGGKASTLLGTLTGALRNLLLDVTSGVLPISSGQFDASALVFAFPTNSSATFDYDAGLLGAKGIVLSGLSTNKIVNGATLGSTGVVQTLTIKIDTEFVLNSSLGTIRLTGTLIATQSALPTLTSIQVQGQTVTLRGQQIAPAAALQSSTDLKAWSIQPATRSDDSNGAVFTLSTNGARAFYRVTQ